MDKERNELIQGLCMMDDILMSSVLRDKKCAEVVLRIILQDPGLEVLEVRTQETVANLYGRAIRMDVKAVTSKQQLCNIEVQRSNQGASPKRARYNSSLIDANATQPGRTCKELPEQYVIFITERDPLGHGLPMYHIERIITETGERFGDGEHIIYVNGEIQDDTVLGLLMRDFHCVDPRQMHYRELSEENWRLKRTEEGLNEMYGIVDQLVQEGVEKGMRKGVAIGGEEKARAIAARMFARGDSFNYIADTIEVPAETIRSWIENAGMPDTPA